MRGTCKAADLPAPCPAASPFPPELSRSSSDSAPLSKSPFCFSLNSGFKKWKENEQSLPCCAPWPYLCFLPEAGPWAGGQRRPGTSRP